MALSAQERDAYLRACRSEALRVIESLVPGDKRGHPAYRAVLDYPLREAKGLRPAIAIATCRALGGGLAEIVPTAAVFELLHNAFLVHDDVEDGSEMRRHAPTLSAVLGLPLAVHTGDTMLALALGPLLDNMRLLDLGRALRILDLVADVIRRTVEGQALELTWIAQSRWDLAPEEYVDMVRLKTAWYTFCGPLIAGALVAEADAGVAEQLRDFGLDLGVAFQIRDDVLNLRAPSADTGKESWGDLWEGKRTLVLALFMARADRADRAWAAAVLGKRRPNAADDKRAAGDLDLALEATAAAGVLEEHQRKALQREFQQQRARGAKSASEVADLRARLEPSIADAHAVAMDFADRARARWTRIRPALEQSIHRDLIESILDYTTARDR
jgi:geranylgeranyl diphosphate synthase, type II